MQIQSLKEDQLSYLLLSALIDKSSLSNLMDFLSPSLKEEVAPAYQELLDMDEDELQETIRLHLKQLTKKQKDSSLNKIHPDWIVDRLQNESPRMIATMLRYLPGEQVQYILNRLPQNIIEQMPSLVETFSLDPEVLLYLKKSLEQLFVTESSIEKSDRDSSFQSLFYLPYSHIEKFFWELGIFEFALSLTSLSDKLKEILLERFEPQVRNSLMEKMSVVDGKYPDYRIKQAQGHVLSLDLEKKTPAGLILECGFALFARAILVQNLESLILIEQKLKKDDAALLRHYVEKTYPLNTGVSVLGYRQEIMEVLRKTLS